MTHLPENFEAAPALAPETNPHHEAEFEADAKRLALELECIILDCKDTAISAKWWDSGMEALEQHRKLLADTAELAPFPPEQQPSWIRNALPPDAPAPAEPKGEHQDADYAALEREHLGDPDKRTGIYAPKAEQQASFPERDASKTNAEQGLYRKFEVRRVDGSDAPGGKHHDCEYFVLDMTHDRYAKAALRTYAQLCHATHPQLAYELDKRYDLMHAQADQHRAPFLPCPISEETQRQFDALVDETRALLSAHSVPMAESLPQPVLEALRFYANGHHYNIDDDHQQFDTVSGEPVNWLHSEREDDCTMIEDGSIAKAALQGKLATFEEPSPAIEGEVFAAATLELGQEFVDRATTESDGFTANGAPSAPTPAEQHRTSLPTWFDAFLTNVCEIPDRNSPEGEPEAIVATLDELKRCALDAIESQGESA